MKTYRTKEGEVLELVRRAVVIKKGNLFVGNWGKSLRLRHGNSDRSRAMALLDKEHHHYQGQPCYVIIVPVGQIKKPRPIKEPRLSDSDCSD